MAYYVGIDIGGTNTRLLTMNEQDEFILRENIPTSSWSATENPLEMLAQLINAHFRALFPLRVGR